MARLLQIPWIPGLGPGPSLERYALPDRSSDLYNDIPKFSLPTRGQLAFSFAGLKSNVERTTKKYHSNLKMPMKEGLKRAMARRFQEAAVGHVEEKVGMALDLLKDDDEELEGKRLRSLVVSGGVASNAYLRER
jgi:N6-L-threonylcarbamoyladenine synthase